MIFKLHHNNYVRIMVIVGIAAAALTAFRLAQPLDELRTLYRFSKVPIAEWVQLNSLIERQPDDVYLRKKRATLYLQLYTTLLHAPDRTVTDIDIVEECASKDIERALRLEPSNGNLWHNLLALTDGDEEYLTVCTQAIKAGADVPSFLSYRAHCFGQKEMWKEASADYDRLTALTPEDRAAYMERGDARRRHGELELAIADFDKALALSSDCSDTVLVSRALCFELLDRHSEALKDCYRAISVQPDNEQAYRIRDRACQQSGQPVCGPISCPVQPTAKESWDVNPALGCDRPGPKPIMEI